MNSGQCILVFGATSAICHEVLKLYALDAANFFLVGRSEQKLLAISTDLVARGGTVLGTASYDFGEWPKHEATVLHALECMGRIDIAFVAHGTLPDQSECETSSALVKSCMEDNFVSVAIIAQAVAQQLAQQRSGTLAVLSSVAGDRGRKSNYTYGAAKAGIDTLLQGLQGRFSGSGIKVVNIKPGMVISPMTSEMRHSAIWSTPEKVAPGIYQAVAKGKKVYYVPGYWRLIMLIIRLLPTGILAKLPI